jgi:tRNA nucleotidyltransferase (CCA-adding enzyme)
MKVLTVGGSVRDKLLGLVPHDIDYLVVGSTPAEMEALGYSQVGKDFPVYLHPETNEEYALARTERKSGLKHTDFETVFDSSVTVEEDLLRRDLTINAIAMPFNFEGPVVDPFNGLEDLQNKVLRHVSEAFGEDPLRVLRLARFTVKFPEFTVHPDTVKLCRNMAANGDLNHLTRHRVFEETKKAFSMDNSFNYLNALSEFGATSVLFDELVVNDSEISDTFFLIEELGKGAVSLEEMIMHKFATLFFPTVPHLHTAEVLEAAMLNLKLPSDTILFAKDVAMFLEIDDAVSEKNVTKIVKLLNKFNPDSRLMKSTNWLEMVFFCFGVNTRNHENMVAIPFLRFLIKNFMTHKMDLKDFMFNIEKNTGKLPSGAEIGKAANQFKQARIEQALMAYSYY